MLTHPISIHDKALFESYLEKNPYEISDINFTNLFMWRHLYNIKYEILHDLLWISGVYYNKPFFFPPLFKKAEDLKNMSLCLSILKERAHGHKFMIKFIPESMIKTLEEASLHQLSFERDRNNDDYVYLSTDLVTLKGRKFHSKKNHLNYFLRTTDFQYKSLTHEHIAGCLDLTKRLKTGNYTSLEMDLINNEEKAIEEALFYMDPLNFVGSVILINGKVEAFTFGEPLADDTMLVHIEKANSDIRGLYQAINQQFCQYHCQEIQYVNREEDMGFDYLRKAKESYHPIKMMEKYDGFLI